MPYGLDQFIADCRATLSRDPGPAGREEVRQKLERLLTNKEFVAQTCGDDVPHGLKVLYEDKELGFQILAHVNDKARKSPPHDHGASWAIYGQATKHTDMIEWERTGGDDKHAELKEVKRYRLNPGPGRHLSGRRDPFDRLSGPRALHPRHRHQPRQHPPRALRPEDRRSASHDAAAGDVEHVAGGAEGRRGGAARDAARRRGAGADRSCARSASFRKAISCSRARCR